VTKYRFYLLNRYDEITEVHIAECDGADAIEETALLLLAEREAAVAVEAWDGPVRVYRQSDYGFAPA
jgi:hypothetical protein